MLGVIPQKVSFKCISQYLALFFCLGFLRPASRGTDLFSLEGKLLALGEAAPLGTPDSKKLIRIKI